MYREYDTWSKPFYDNFEQTILFLFFSADKLS